MARIREKTLKFPGLNNTYTFADEADLFDANVDCTAGKYYIYSGDTYRCLKDHTGSWSDGDFVLVKLGNELAAFKKNTNYSDITITPTSGKYVNGSGALANGSAFRYTAYGTPVKNGDVVTLIAKGYSTTVCMIYKCDSDGENRVPLVMSIDDQTRVYTTTITEDGYIGFCYHNSVAPVAYKINNIAHDEIDEINSVLYSVLTPTITTHESGKYISTNTSIGTYEGSSYSEAIPVIKGDEIHFTCIANTSMAAIAYCDSDINNRVLAKAGESYSVQEYVQVADRTGYIALSYYTNNIHELKIYRYFESQNSLASGSTKQLLGKKMVWCGDSHVLGATFNDTKKGWRGRISDACGCWQYNYAEGGACITKGVSQSRTAIVDQIENAYTDHPDADFIIFDGGCNDADLIGNATGETKPEAYGTFSENDFSGNYDDTTFCGAMETICMKLSQHWLGKHVGYIVPQKQGVSNNYHSGSNNYRTYYETAIQICNKWGIQVLNLWDGCYLNPKHNWMCDTDNTMTNEEIYAAGFLYADRQHMTEAGYDFEAPIINAWVHTI